VKRVRVFLLFVLLFSCSYSFAMKIPVYFFTDEHCPDCRQTGAILEELKEDFPLKIRYFRADESLKSLRPLYQKRQFVPREIPIVLIGEEILEGSHPEETYRRVLRDYKEDTFASLFNGEGDNGPTEIKVAWKTVLAAVYLIGIYPGTFSVFLFMIIS